MFQIPCSPCALFCGDTFTQKLQERLPVCFAATPVVELPQRLVPLTRTPSAPCRRPPFMTVSVCLHIVYRTLFWPLLFTISGEPFTIIFLA
jgi:hypothetical protein